MPIRVDTTQDTTEDCSQASRLVEGITAEYLLADRNYDNDTIGGQAKTKSMNRVTPSHAGTEKHKEIIVQNLIVHGHIDENIFYISNNGAYRHALCQTAFGSVFCDEHY
ncbi:hypothetical protein SAMN06296273_0423 [Nitrosomonas ureae]|uniref:Transposase DDE domain-containing protein n=1 Tax=Nitrosomonas ureae TaxID=44577 RepID=A0A285BUQ9_9PROT|nr:hypothetical protein [Nitrosomonas ureae]SNX58962.1 hypothetical protein SAMN06296273_0423 [Nitrosomonas ureae]